MIRIPFAQHILMPRGLLDRKVFDSIVKEVGAERAKRDILASRLRLYRHAAPAALAFGSVVWAYALWLLWQVSPFWSWHQCADYALRTALFPLLCFWSAAYALVMIKAADRLGLSSSA